MGQLTLIVLICLLSICSTEINSKSSAANTASMCKDLSTEQLSEMMYKYEEITDGAFSFIDVESISNSLGNLVVPDSVSNHQPKNCVPDSNVYLISKGLCPSHEKLVYRYNRFPHMIMYNVCDCGSCANINRDIEDYEFSCQPLRKLHPCLVRGRCARNGVYEWRPALEYISIACLCMRNGTNVPV